MDLKSLLVSQESVAEESVAKTLAGLVSIVTETGEVLPLAALGKLDESTRILAYLLARRAAVTLGAAKIAAASSENISASLGMDIQRVREHLSRGKKTFLNKTTEGYEMKVARIPSACEEIDQRRKA